MIRLPSNRDQITPVLMHLNLGPRHINAGARRQRFSLGARSRQGPRGTVPQRQDPVAGNSKIDALTSHLKRGDADDLACHIHHRASAGAGRNGGRDLQ